MATILIAEDDGQMRTFLAAALRRAGHYVEAVECGEDALIAFDGTDFDLLLADVVMPGMNPRTPTSANTAATTSAACWTRVRVVTSTIGLTSRFGRERGRSTATKWVRARLSGG